MCIRIACLANFINQTQFGECVAAVSGVSRVHDHSCLSLSHFSLQWQKAAGEWKSVRACICRICGGHRGDFLRARCRSHYHAWEDSRPFSAVCSSESGPSCNFARSISSRTQLPLIDLQPRLSSGQIIKPSLSARETSTLQFELALM